MKRPALLIASAVGLSLLSLLQILMALLMVLTATTAASHALPLRPGAPPAPEWMPVFFYGLAAVCAGLAAWGIATAIGAYRLRRWARYSILIIGGCMAAVGCVSLLFTAVSLAAFSSLAPAGAAGAHASPVTVTAIFAVIGLFYAAIAAIGIFWLVYFNRKPVRALFAGGVEPEAEGRRPILISVYAVLSLLGTALLIAMTFLPLPTVLFGVAFTGWKKAAIDLLCAGIDAAIGIGLWKMAEWARRLALGFLAVGGAMMVLYLARPSLIMRNDEAVRRAMGLTPTPLPGHVQTVMYAVIFGLSLLLMAAIAWMLHYYRGRFASAAPVARIPAAQ